MTDHFYDDLVDRRETISGPVGALTVELFRSPFYDIVRVRSPSTTRGSMMRKCRHRHGPTLFDVIVEMCEYITTTQEAVPSFPPLPDSRRKLNRHLASIEAQAGIAA